MSKCIMSGCKKEVVTRGLCNEHKDWKKQKMFPIVLNYKCTTCGEPISYKGQCAICTEEPYDRE